MRPTWAERLAPVAFVLVWSTGFIGSKYTVPYAPPFSLLTIRLSLAAVALAILSLVFRSTWPRTRDAYTRSALIGVLLHGGYLGAVFVSIEMGLPVAVAALIVCLQPVSVAALSHPMLGTPLTRRQWTGIVLGLTGVLVVLAPGLAAGAGADGYERTAVLVGVVALVCSTVATLLQKKHGHGIPMLPGTAVQYAAAAVVLGVMALAFDRRPVLWTPQFIGALAWMVVALSIGAVLLMFWLLRRGTAAGFSSLYYLVPPVTLVMGYLLFGQTLPPVALVGFAISSLGVLLVRDTA